MSRFLPRTPRWSNFRAGAVSGALLISLSCSAPTEPVTSRETTDADGVAMLLAAGPGARFRLGMDDPNRARNFQIERKTPAERRSDGALQYWNIAGHDLDYASGGSGKTTRLHIYASGGQQRETWRTQKGYLSSPQDIGNQEFTAFMRVHGMTDPKRAAITFKIRGGAHSAKHPDLASCTMMSFQAKSMGAVARFGKELTHPIYDYVRLTPAFDAALVDNRWFGLKLVSYGAPGQPARVINRLYLDDDPFDTTTGRPRNRWRLLAEYIDIEGVGTGNYAKLADWGGWQTTLRSDGIGSLDFTLISLREIEPAK